MHGALSEDPGAQEGPRLHFCPHSLHWPGVLCQGTSCEIVHSGLLSPDIPLSVVVTLGGSKRKSRAGVEGRAEEGPDTAPEGLLVGEAGQGWGAEPGRRDSSALPKPALHLGQAWNSGAAVTPCSTS